MKNRMQLLCVYDDTREIYIGWFEGLEHIVAYGDTISQVNNELFKSLAVVADYSIKHSVHSQDGSGVIKHNILLSADC